MLRRFTGDLETVTEKALARAVAAATAGQDARDSIVPVVVGGDDVTVVCDARFALTLVRAFALAWSLLAPEMAVFYARGHR